MIAITFALPTESSSLVRRLARRNVRRQGKGKIIAGQLGQNDVEIVHTGVGAKIAETRLHDYLNAQSPAWLISSGFAGAARGNYRVGDLVLAQNYSDSDLLEQARRLLRQQNVHAAKIFTAPAMVDSLAEREELWQRHEAVAIDMETEAIARVCADRQLRMLSIRVLSDTPRHPFPLPGDILFDLERQRTPAGPLLRHLLVHPGAIPRLLRFSRQIGKARRALTDALVQLLQSDL